MKSLHHKAVGHGPFTATTMTSAHSLLPIAKQKIQRPCLRAALSARYLISAVFIVLLTEISGRLTPQLASLEAPDTLWGMPYVPITDMARSRKELTISKL